MRPIVMTIAGSDPSGGAGIQADVKSIEAAGGYARAVVAAITVQSTSGVERSVPVDPELVLAQLDGLAGDNPPQAIKTGLLGSAEVIRAVAGWLKTHSHAPLVCDPVLASGAGKPLLDENAIEALREALLPLADVVTPNAPEAEALTGIPVRDLESASAAGHKILDLGARAVLVKGGHVRPGTDFLVVRGRVVAFEGRPIVTRHGHGTGCALASALATNLARGLDLEAAVGEARAFVAQALDHALDTGPGPGPIDPLFFLHHDYDNPTPPWARSLEVEEPDR